jgi:hypothetical protein
MVVWSAYKKITNDGTSGSHRWKVQDQDDGKD